MSWWKGMHWGTMSTNFHLCLSIPPKFSVANTIGFLKGKSAIMIHREFLGRDRNFTVYHFWARGYCVSTVGLDEKTIREYIRKQEEEEKRQEQLPLGGLEPPSPPKKGPFHYLRGPSGALHQTTRSALTVSHS